MMMKHLFAKLKNKRYRAAYLAQHIRTIIALQIRRMREDRGWKQSDLGDVSGKPQNVISRIEDPEYGKLTVQTLLDLAAGLDVGLVIKFVPFSRFLREYEDVSMSNLSVDSFLEEFDSNPDGPTI